MSESQTPSDCSLCVPWDSAVITRFITFAFTLYSTKKIQSQLTEQKIHRLFIQKESPPAGHAGLS